MSGRSPNQSHRRIARERIEILFERAGEFFPIDPAWSDRCVALARKIGMRHRVRIHRSLRGRFCRSCNRYLVPGRNARVRMNRGKVTTTCLSCGSCRRLPIRGMRHER